MVPLLVVRQERIVYQCPLSLNQQKLQKGAFSYRRNGNMLMMKYQDKKEVYFLSSIHQATSKVTGKKKQRIDVVKPMLVQDYNKYMGGIDPNDAMLGNYSSVRKSMKWTTKVAFHFMEESTLNAFYLFDKVVGGQRLLQFKLNIVRALFDTTNEISPLYNLPSFGRHFLELIPPTEKKHNPQKRCKVCHKEGLRKETSYQCKNCVDKPGLCPAPCFEIYHK